MTDELHLRTTDGTMLAVPASLASITTYVLLEQERWFEKETRLLRHVLRPGMTAIDVGANLGVYSLPMARLVAPGGRVFAYEPAAETCRLLRRSRALNEADGLEILPVALSDGAREGRLAWGASSELNALDRTADGRGESVPVSSLDIEDAKRGWRSPAFVKIDAEGEEARIVSGGAAFFARHSPLAMFEVKAGSAVNEGARRAFSALGYGLYRQLGDAPVLVPIAPDAPLDGFELNLFAAKPDRAADLAARGLLVRSLPEWSAPAMPPGWLRERFAAQPFAGHFAAGAAGARLDLAYADALTAFACWRDDAFDLPARCAALDASLRHLRALCADAPSFTRLSTLARVAWEAGARDGCVAALHAFFEEAGRRACIISEPFWPACPRYDTVDPAGRPVDWFTSAAIEQLERARAHSTLFAGASPALDLLCGKPFATAEMERRRVLLAAKAGLMPTVPARLGRPAADHLNAEIWRAGEVPGTRP